MLAFDHGYFQGPTTGLERVDITIKPLIPSADALMLTRGILRSVIDPSSTNAVVMRASGGPSILKELSDERIAVDMEDALRMNVSAVAVGPIGGVTNSDGQQHDPLVDKECAMACPCSASAGCTEHSRRPKTLVATHGRMGVCIGTYFVPGFNSSCAVRADVIAGGKTSRKGRLQMARDAIVGRLGRGHGQEHLPVRVPRCHDRGRPQGRTTTERQGSMVLSGYEACRSSSVITAWGSRPDLTFRTSQREGYF
jgi:putative autoinducer-2 (AI-2) aldolase